ncbi:MAG: hypothetical protein HQL75_04370 [Magnetococcales bacterium]|nr:hypothetical protein [Magnetococcales bacterium]
MIDSFFALVATIVSLVVALLTIGMFSKKQETMNTINPERVLEELMRLRDEAAAEGQFTAAVRATELIGKHLSMFVDRVEHKTDIDFATRLMSARRRNHEESSDT